MKPGSQTVSVQDDQTRGNEGWDPVIDLQSCIYILNISKEMMLFQQQLREKAT